MKIRTFGAEIRWEKQRDEWRQTGTDEDGNPVGQAEVEKTITVIDKPMWGKKYASWIGLFGGFSSRDNTEWWQKVLSPAFEVIDAVRAWLHGQVQEVTVDVYWQAPKRENPNPENPNHWKARNGLHERDLHQLWPAMSFSGWEREHDAWPTPIPAGSRIFYVARTSQKDRGAHTRVRVYLFDDDPYNTLVHR